MNKYLNWIIFDSIVGNSKRIIPPALLAQGFVDRQTNVGDRQPYIIGGTLASIFDFPYQLSLRQSQTHICGASIISAQFAVTAAHCLDSDVRPYAVSSRPFGIRN